MWHFRTSHVFFISRWPLLRTRTSVNLVLYSCWVSFCNLFKWLWMSPKLWDKANFLFMFICKKIMKEATQEYMREKKTCNPHSVQVLGVYHLLSMQRNKMNSASEFSVFKHNINSFSECFLVVMLWDFMNSSSILLFYHHRDYHIFISGCCLHLLINNCTFKLFHSFIFLLFYHVSPKPMLSCSGNLLICKYFLFKHNFCWEDKYLRLRSKYIHFSCNMKACAFIARTQVCIWMRGVVMLHLEKVSQDQVFSCTSYLLFQLHYYWCSPVTSVQFLDSFRNCWMRENRKEKKNPVDHKIFQILMFNSENFDRNISPENSLKTWKAAVQSLDLL